MNYSKPTDVTAILRNGDDVERVRGTNRVRINNAANGFPPMSEAEAARWNQKLNVAWGEMPVLFQQARRQYYNAFLKPGNYFKVTLPIAPAKTQTHWGNCITTQINRIMKRSLPYSELVRSKFASVVAHGIGPIMWDDRETWLPRYVALEDMRVPTDTELSLRNLEWFAERRFYTEGELVDKVWGENRDNGWNKDIVKKIVAAYHPLNYTMTEPYDWLNLPEKAAELIKQNLGYWTSDAVPTIPLFHFYHRGQSGDDRDKWFMCVVPDENTRAVPDRGQASEDWIYQSDKPVSDDRAQLLHVQFGDLNNKAPFLWHATRSLGLLLYEPCFWTNLLRCRFVQHVFESLNIWLRVNDPVDRDRAQKIELFDRAIIPAGVEVVPMAQRHNINPDLINNVMAQLRQLMSEASASYTQEIDSGTDKEQTATETMAKVSQVNAMMSGLLATAFMYETFAYQEISRRFCLSRSDDKDVKEFQAECKRLGVPREWLNVNRWQITPEVPIGSGNPTMEMTMAQLLMANRASYSPSAQAQILHLFTEAATGNPILAEELAPAAMKRDITDSQEIAGAAFGALMQGVPPPVRENVSNLELVEVLIGMLAGKITGLAQGGNTATASDLIGMQTTSQFIAQRIDMLAQDEAMAPQAKMFSQSLGKLDNEIRGFAQRLAEEQRKKAQEGNGEAEAKVQALMATTQAKLHSKGLSDAQKLKNKELSEQQKLKHKDVAFISDQHRKDALASGEIQRKGVTTGVDISLEHARTSADIKNAERKADETPTGD